MWPRDHDEVWKARAHDTEIGKRIIAPFVFKFQAVGAGNVDVVIRTRNRIKACRIDDEV